MLCGPLLHAQNSKVVSAFNYLKFYEQDGDKQDLGKAKEAIDLAAQHEKTSENPKTWYYRGIIYHKITENPENHDLAGGDHLITAYVSYRKSLEIDPKKRFKREVMDVMPMISHYFYKEGVDNYNMEHFKIAYQQFKAVLDIQDLINEYDKLNMTDTATMLSTAYAAEKAKLIPEAKELYIKLIELKKVEAAVYQSLSNIYKAEGDTAKALETIELGREQDPNNKALIIDELNIYMAAGKHQELIEKLKKAVEIDPQNPDLYFTLGTTYDNLGQDPQAITAYEKALELDPDYFEVLYNLGAVHYNKAIGVHDTMGQLSLNQQTKYDSLKETRDRLFRMALPFFEKACTINTEAINALLAIREIYLRLGMDEKSEEIKAQIDTLKAK